MDRPYPNAIPRENGPYLLDISAYGGASPVTRQFRLYVTDQGQLTEELK